MDRNKELKVHRLRLPGRSLCSIRSNRKWCKRRGSSLQCQNCFFVYPIIDCNLKNLSKRIIPIFHSISKLATTSSTGGLLLALQRAIVTIRPKGRYRKHFCWPAIKRYYSNLLVSILLLALLYTFELLHLLYCQSFQHNIL